jgi:delta-aminolevulinic acid dehydratase/porphobilinogen synthase
MFMYPIFITDDPDASVEIATLPGQRRWGVNKLEGFIGPLVKKGLESVILFGVPLTCVKVRFSWIFALFCSRCAYCDAGRTRDTR